MHTNHTNFIATLDSSVMSALAQFASRVVNKDKRIALVLEMGPGMSLAMTNSTRLPYLISGKQDNGSEEFLCPAVGRNEAPLQGCVERFKIENGRILIYN